MYQVDLFHDCLFKSVRVSSSFMSEDNVVHNKAKGGKEVLVDVWIVPVLYLV